jgi:hypothetical protein
MNKVDEFKTGEELYNQNEKLFKGIPLLVNVKDLVKTIVDIEFGFDSFGEYVLVYTKEGAVYRTHSALVIKKLKSEIETIKSKGLRIILRVKPALRGDYYNLEYPKDEMLVSQPELKSE